MPPLVHTVGTLIEHLQKLVTSGEARETDTVMMRFHLDGDVIIGHPVTRTDRDRFHGHLNLHGHPPTIGRRWWREELDE